MGNSNSNERFRPFAEKMIAEGLPTLGVDIFRHYYDQLVAGATGYIPGVDAGPVDGIPDYEELDDDMVAAGERILDKVVLLKLNGGLGTGMGMNGPKSLVEVKNGLNFLDIILRQVLHLRCETDCRVPLLLMNSFSTHKETAAALQTYPDFIQDIPVDFLQHKKPRIWTKTLAPVKWPDDPEKEWCPPGHGDIYPSLLTSGMLAKMLEAGYEYVFVSNSDNLGAVLDRRILGYMATNNLPFLMEVAYRTKADRKGGHLARRSDGQLVLRELAQCPPGELDAFQDVDLYRFFNTNNLWVHLPTLYDVMHHHDDLLDLPLIRNKKPVDPTQPDSPRVYQLETAMGSAIALFEGAQAIRVPRARFIPVKRNNDLLVIWSDVYTLTDDCHLMLAAQRRTTPPRRPPLVELDPRYYGLIDELELRFPHGAPSMLQCTSLCIEGDVRFGRNVVLEGDVHIVNGTDTPRHIPDGMHLRGTVG